MRDGRVTAKRPCYNRCMEERIDTSEEFSLVKQAKSFAYAGRGIYIFVRTTHNAWVHIVILIATIGLGIVLGISRMEWMMLVFAAGMVLTAEAFNTAIEIDIDLTSPEYHPYARDTKDVAAGAVLISAVAAVLIGILVFAPYCMTLLG